MKKYIFLLFILFIAGECDKLRAADLAASTSFKAMQMNVWMGGSRVEGALQLIVDEIIHSDADVIFFNEMRKVNGETFESYMVSELKKRGQVYYGTETALSVGILSRFPIDEQRVLYQTTKGSNGAMLRAQICVAGRKVALYATHLDYKHYACYMPRGYNGTTWKKMDAPVTDEMSVLQMNRKAYREERISDFIRVAKSDIDQGNVVLLGGDFNEPSHLDWQEDTKNLYGHNGAVIRWDCSRLLYEAGFKDAYREVYPNAVTHPGFTFPAGNKGVAIKELTWAPDADERDRIDFIYFYSPEKKNIVPRKAWVVGPSLSVVKATYLEENTRDRFLLPKGGWPTDHKAVMVSFKIRK